MNGVEEAMCPSCSLVVKVIYDKVSAVKPRRIYTDIC